MRVAWTILILLSACGLASAQGTVAATPGSSQQTPSQPIYYASSYSSSLSSMAVLPDAPEPTTELASPDMAPFQRMKGMIKHQINHAIDSNGYPDLVEWKPLTTKQKFQVFLHSTYSPQTFANAAIDETMDRVQGHHLNPAYERGMMGVGQRYGIELSTNETDVFFQRFLLPTLLKEDPRYFRNPDLPVFPRILYSMSRVIITRSDNGGQTFNASRVLGSMASQAVSDLYVPGDQQGLHPLSGCITFNLLRDAGANLFKEFWPDLRHKFLHR
jgi:hypothetical protein